MALKKVSPKKKKSLGKLPKAVRNKMGYAKKGAKVVKKKIFKNDNNWNEKAIVGFIAFAIMCLIMVADLVTGWVGTDLVINEFVYDSFVWVVLGSFGISGLEKFAKK